MRSRRGSRAAQAENGTSGSGSGRTSPGIGCAIASSIAAASRTVRARDPSPASPVQSLPTGPALTRPRLGLNPTIPQQLAGMRMDPPPSLPSASGTSRAATAAAAPPLDPPALRVRSHGVRAGPTRSLSV